MDLNPIILSIPLYFLLIGIELLIERLSHKKIYRLNDALTNISCGITQQLTGIFLKVLGVTVFVVVYQYRFFTIPDNAFTFVILIIAADFCYYWAHRMSHEINLFWGGHVVHHQSEDYNFSVALRQGSFQIIWTFAFYLPLALIGFNPTTFVFASALVTVYQFWIHTETIGKLGWFEYVFNTPSHHRVHHGRDPKYIDRNHAGMLIIWDRMFGTFQEEEETPVYGITKPTNSWNPVWVNVAHYVEMWQTLKTIEGFRNKLKYIFYPPGWLPDSMGGKLEVPSVERSSYNKYNPDFPPALIPYIFMQYLVILGATAAFLFTYQEDAWILNAILVCLLIISVVASGILLENKPWMVSFEIGRLIFTLGVIGMLVYAFSFPIGWLIGGFIYLGVSLLWLIFVQRKLRTKLA
jgi:sterol desaturase/sphingolipid hydroxylase (fatty acid hydroxylase superfamily)